MAGALRMRDDLLALLLMLVGLGCIVAWGVCQAVLAIRASRLRREADAIKLHVVKGGRLPDGAPSILARSYLHVRWLGIVGNILLFSGIVGMALAQVIIF
jgi:predicted small integral membrane protein